jgi:hypothetical protein
MKQDRAHYGVVVWTAIPLLTPRKTSRRPPKGWRRFLPAHTERLRRLMSPAINYSYRVDRAKSDAGNFRWIIFKRYREVGRSHAIFATSLDAQAAAKLRILRFTRATQSK